MFLRFEDWSTFIPSLDKKGIPHGDRIIKVFTSEEDPRKLFGKADLIVFESDGAPFTDEVFDMRDRGSFTGKEIDDSLSERGITEVGKEIIRALLRFSTQPETQFTQIGMQLKVDGKFLIDHPLGDIDGLSYGAPPHNDRERDIHLDVFEPESLARLHNLVDYDDPSKIISMSDRMDFRRKEGQARRSIEI